MENRNIDMASKPLQTDSKTPPHDDLASAIAHLIHRLRELGPISSAR